MDEGPVVLGLAGAHAGVEGRLGAGRQTRQGGRGRYGGLERPAVRALYTLTFSCVTGVGAPAAARLFQTLTACSVTGAVLRCGKNTQQQQQLKKKTLYDSLLPLILLYQDSSTSP